jgi:DNA processing protein
VRGIGPIFQQRLWRKFGSLQAAWHAPRAELASLEGLGPRSLQRLVESRSQLDPVRFYQQHQAHNPHFCTPVDGDYPLQLLALPDPPPVLYVRGQASMLATLTQQRAVAIVGTRSPSNYGLRWTEALTRALVGQGYWVVSGLAEGIDTKAHQSCLAAGGTTVAILGTGVDRVYPACNYDLARAIAHSGLHLSEYPAGTAPNRLHFPRRNRIVAGLCQAVLVLEAPARSGALITAHLANDYGREVFALPGSLDNANSLGCLELINQGAQLILGEAQLLERLAALPRFDPACPGALGVGEIVPGQIPAPPRPAPVQLNLSAAAAPSLANADLAPIQATVLQELRSLVILDGAESITLERLALHMASPVHTISAALLQLELKDLVLQLPGMTYRPQGNPR